MSVTMCNTANIKMSQPAIKAHRPPAESAKLWSSAPTCVRLRPCGMLSAAAHAIASKPSSITILGAAMLAMPDHVYIQQTCSQISTVARSGHCKLSGGPLSCVRNITAEYGKHDRCCYCVVQLPTYRIHIIAVPLRQ
jgi:hypothetical protein